MLTLPNGIVVEYSYDDDSRLTGLTYKLGMTNLGTLTYGYDVNGQRTTRERYLRADSSACRAGVSHLRRRESSRDFWRVVIQRMTTTGT